MGELAHDAPLVHDQDAIAFLDDLVEVAGNHQHAAAVVGKRADQAVQFESRADIDAESRFIEDQDPRIGGEPAGEQIFC